MLQMDFSLRVFWFLCFFAYFVGMFIVKIPFVPVLVSVGIWYLLFLMTRPKLFSFYKYKIRLLHLQSKEEFSERLIFTKFKSFINNAYRLFK